MFGLDAGVHVHLAVDGDDLIAPISQLFHQVVEGVPELGEDEQLAISQVLEDVVAQAHQLALDLLSPHPVGLGDQPVEFGDLYPHVVNVPGDGQVFQSLLDLEPLLLSHILQLFLADVAGPQIVLVLADFLRQLQ